MLSVEIDMQKPRPGFVKEVLAEYHWILKPVGQLWKVRIPKTMTQVMDVKML